jgi:hypothetical protein
MRSREKYLRDERYSSNFYFSTLKFESTVAVPGKLEASPPQNCLKRVNLIPTCLHASSIPFVGPDLSNCSDKNDFEHALDFKNRNSRSKFFTKSRLTCALQTLPLFKQWLVELSRRQGEKLIQ